MGIEERLRRLEAKEAIRELRYAYASAVDSHDWERFVDLFTDDARIGFPQDEADQTPFEGQEGIRQFGQAMGEHLTYSAHMMHNPTITVDGDEATGQWYVEVPEVTPEGPVLIQGRYEDEYRRTGDGWKFAAVDVYYHYRVTPDEGWTLSDIERWRDS